MNWLGIVVIAYLGLVIVELTWVFCSVHRFDRDESRRGIFFGLSRTKQLRIYGAACRWPSGRPKQPPANLSIRPRNLSFGGEIVSRRSWLGGDPVATAFYNALSACFPSGERFFMDSVRQFRDCATDPLRGQIAAFLSQEAAHTREHIIFNSQIAAYNPSIAVMQARAEARLKIARTRHPLQQLGETIALEHLTAILADALLSDSRHLAGAPNNIQAMWRWHAIEEIEHKAVAFDTFVAATSSLSSVRRWALRVSTMTMSTWQLVATMGCNVSDSFTIDGINRSATWARLFKYLLVSPGILRQALPGYFAYFLPGFHPWRHDNRALMISAEKGLTKDLFKGAAR
jgi:uncharacterized protein